MPQRITSPIEVLLNLSDRYHIRYVSANVYLLLTHFSPLVDMNKPASGKAVGVSDNLNAQGIIQMLEAPVYVLKIHMIRLEATVRTLITLNPVASLVKIVPLNVNSGRYGAPGRLFRIESEVE